MERVIGYVEQNREGILPWFLELSGDERNLIFRAAVEDAEDTVGHLLTPKLIFTVDGM